MECHHVVTNGPIVSTVHHEALVAMDTVIAHKITRCPTYLKPYQHFTIRLSRSKCYKQDDNFLFDKTQRSPLNISILIKGEDGTTLQVLNTVRMLYVYSDKRRRRHYLTGSQHSAYVVRIQCSTGPFRTFAMNIHTRSIDYSHIS